MVKKLQAPTSKHQRSSKFQILTRAGRKSWSLLLGASLELGAWMLELSFPPSRNLPILPEARLHHALVPKRPIYFVEQPEVERDEQATDQCHHEPLPRET